MSVYQEQRKASLMVDEEVFKLLQGQATEVNISGLILSVTRKLAVPEKYVMKRIELFLQSYPGELKKEDYLLKKV